MTEIPQLEFQNYYMLLLIIPVLLGWFLSARSNYYITKLLYGRGREVAMSLRAILPRLFFLSALLVLIVALAEPTRSYLEIKELLSRVRIMLGLDNSSSMYKFEELSGPIYCTSKELEIIYPRIYTGCRTLHLIIDGTEKFAQQKTSTEKDQIALVRFALYSKVQSYPTSNYNRLRNAVNDMNWNAKESIGVHTEIHLALWDLYLLAFDRNRRKNTLFTQFTSTDMDRLVNALTPESLSTPFSIPRELEAKLIAMRKELRDTIFILFTDAHAGQLENRLNKSPVSFKKMTELAMFLEVPIYIISVDLNNEIFKELVGKTGFGPPEGKHRGDFLVVGHGTVGKYASVEQLVNTILESHSDKTTPVVSLRRESYAVALSLIALTLFVLGLVLRQTTGRSLSEP